MQLNLNLRMLNIVPIAILVSTMLLACAKDSDSLLGEVIEGSNQNPSLDILVDDNFTILPGTTQALNVLENDTFATDQVVLITKVSKPINGNVSINDDNTIAYSAPDSPSEIPDTFTYTTESKDDNGKLTSNTGNVTILITDTPSKTIDKANYLFTPEAKAELKKRFENGYVTGKGFRDDISETLSEVAVFVANPSQYRPIFGDIFGAIDNHGQILHTTAIYAYAIENITVANIVATELLAIVNNNDLYTTYWKTSGKLRWDSTDAQLWVQASKVKKMKDSYNFIENLQNVLTDKNKADIEAWFKRFAELGYNAIRSRIESYLGSGMESYGISKFVPEGIYPEEYGDPTPVQDSSGNDLYIIATAQDIFNNRNWDIVGYIHSWAVTNNDLAIEKWCREFFKISIKYGLFSDGTWWEMQRATDSDPTKGVFYSWVSLGAMVQMAHLDAKANHFPNDRLYDFKTTDGILKGSKNLTTDGYKGTSTTNGTTEKSLFTFISAQAKYLRTEANGGWNNIRFFKNSLGHLIPLSTANTRQPSAIPAMANLYYKSQDLKDLYLYNTTVGYPSKVSIGEGYMASVGNEDSGPWGNMIFGAAWLEQEANFFN